LAGAPRTVEGVRSRSRSGFMRSSERLNAFSIRGRQLARQRRRALARHGRGVRAALRSPDHDGSDGAPRRQPQAPALRDGAHLQRGSHAVQQRRGQLAHSLARAQERRGRDAHLRAPPLRVTLCSPHVSWEVNAKRSPPALCRRRPRTQGRRRRPRCAPPPPPPRARRAPRARPGRPAPMPG